MRIAILILCHNKPDKINRLIESLKDDDIDIFVHIDKKSSIRREIITKNEDVTILPDYLSVDVNWAQFSQVEAELTLLKYASSCAKYDYYLLLSGADYPIVSINKLKEHLQNNKNYNYINLYESKNYKCGKVNHYDKCNDIVYSKWLLKRYGLPRLARRLWVAITGGYNYTFPIFKRQLDAHTKFYYGSQWWCLTGAFVEWALQYLDSNENYISFFKKSSTPDESFFQTLLMNSSFSNTRKDYLHYIDWSEHRNSPKDLTIEDFNMIVTSGKFFARKIFDFSLIDMLDEQNAIRMGK